MDTSQVCEVQDILELTETKQYINFPKVILETLESAVRHKTISDSAMGLWIKLYSIVRSREVVEPEWSVRYSAKRLAEEKGCTEKTILSHLNQLEKGGFIVIDKQRNTLLHEANKIFVRFPKSGIEVAKQVPDRRRTCSTRNIESSQTNKDNLSTDSKRFFHGRSSKNYSSNINNKETNTKNNNTGSGTGLSTIDEISLDDIITASVDCCIASHDRESDNTKLEKELGYMHPKPTRTETELEKLTSNEERLFQRYQETNKLEDFHKLTSCREEIKRRSSIQQKKTQETKTHVSVTETKQIQKTLQLKPRDSRVEVSESIRNYITDRLKRLKKERGFSFTITEQVDAIASQVTNYTYVDLNNHPVTLKHNVNILLAAIKSNRLVTYTRTDSSSTEIRARERAAEFSRQQEMAHATKSQYSFISAA